jgi:hypothetical protein
MLWFEYEMFPTGLYGEDVIPSWLPYFGRYRRLRDGTSLGK